MLEQIGGPAAQAKLEAAAMSGAATGLTIASAEHKKQSWWQAYKEYRANKKAEKRARKRQAKEVNKLEKKPPVYVVPPEYAEPGTSPGSRVVVVVDGKRSRGDLTVGILQQLAAVPGFLDVMQVSP